MDILVALIPLRVQICKFPLRYCFPLKVAAAKYLRNTKYVGQVMRALPKLPLIALE